MTKAPSAHFVAVDLGASSGRVMLAEVGQDRLTLSELHRFRNGPVELPDGLHWDVLGLYLDILEGLRAAAATGVQLTSVGIDSWAVDYGLLDRKGGLLNNPFHYRDARGLDGAVSVHQRIPADRLYQINGIQYQPFNTLYQLAADAERVAQAERVLLIPDLIAFWLTGIVAAEQTNASTTGLLDVRTRDWSAEILSLAGIPPTILPQIVRPGTPLPTITPAVQKATNLPSNLGVVAVGSHDTASAVLAVPADSERFAYISSGTWGLVGVELDEPVLSEASRLNNFTNELGVEGKVRYLRNVMGLWLLQESLRIWRLRGQPHALHDLLAAAGALPNGGPVIDPNADVFMTPSDMPACIAEECQRTGQAVPPTQAGIVRCILDSLARAFADAIADARQLSGKQVDVVHIVGGGSRNELLCQLTADACALPVLAGPVEATALGNVLAQAQAAGVIPSDRWQARSLVARTHPPTVYLPRVTNFAAIAARDNT